MTIPPAIAKPLRLAHARRSNGQWRSMWQHGQLATKLVERRLQSRALGARPSTVLEVQDLGVIDQPYYVLQDLSYDLLLDHFGEGGVPHFRNLGHRRITQLRDRQLGIYEHAAGLLPMSSWLAERSIRSGVDRARVHVINPGVNAPLDDQSPIPERRRAQVKRLLFIGRDFETKAGDQVVAAFMMLRKELGSDITLTIAGPKLWPLRSPIPDGVEFLGPVPVATVQTLYDTHDLFVMPSRFEGFGIAFVEALVRGLPCIGRRACAMPEIIDADSGGFLVDGDSPAELAELIVSALSDDVLYEACAKAAPARRRFYTWDRAAEEVILALGSAS
ncbi:glycosyltransferase family 4 protein [Jatrophihabitans sp. DSM 45814]